RVKLVSDERWSVWGKVSLPLLLIPKDTECLISGLPWNCGSTHGARAVNVINEFRIEALNDLLDGWYLGIYLGVKLSRIIRVCVSRRSFVLIVSLTKGQESF